MPRVKNPWEEQFFAHHCAFDGCLAARVLECLSRHPGIFSSIAAPVKSGVISAGAWYSMLLFDSVAAPGADDDAVFYLIRCPGRHCCSVSITVELAGLRRVYSAVKTHASTSVVRVRAGGTLHFLRQAQSAPGKHSKCFGISNCSRSCHTRRSIPASQRKLNKFRELCPRAIK